ncbi:MAG: hypothetical protein ACK4R3_10925, partial [Aliihoeflea sp.]
MTSAFCSMEWAFSSSLNCLRPDPQPEPLQTLISDLRRIPMKHFASILAAAVAAVSLSNVALAQEDGNAFKLPEQCSAADGASMGHSGMGQMSGGSSEGGMGAMMGMGNMDMDAMPEHVRENMQKMMQTMPAMHEGMMNENPNVAFACGMIAHHQG